MRGVVPSGPAQDRVLPGRMKSNNGADVDGPALPVRQWGARRRTRGFITERGGSEARPRPSAEVSG